MPTRMSVIRLDSHVLGVGALADATALFVTAPFEAQTDYAPRSEHGPAYVQSRYGEATLEVVFSVPSYAAKQAVLRLLDWPIPRDPRDLVVYVGDGDDPLTLIPAMRWVVAASVDAQVGSITVAFTSPDLAWRASAETVTPLLTLAATGGAVAVLNPGHVTVQPTVEIGWTTQRAAGVHSATEGWRSKKHVGPITNLTDRTWEWEGWGVDLGGTGALVTAGKVLGSGGGGQVVNISMAGAIVGKGAAAEIMALIGNDVQGMVNTGYGRNRMQEAR